MKFIRSIIFTPFTFFFVPQSKNASPGLWLTFLTRHTGLLYYTYSCVSTILLMFSQCFLQCFRKYFFLNHPLLISTFSLFLYNFSDNPLKYLKMWFFLNHFDYNNHTILIPLYHIFLNFHRNFLISSLIIQAGAAHLCCTIANTQSQS